MTAAPTTRSSRTDTRLVGARADSPPVDIRSGLVLVLLIVGVGLGWWWPVIALVAVGAGAGYSLSGSV